MTATTVKEAFEQLFNRIEHEVECGDQCHNGTGYFNPMTRFVIETDATFVDKDGRRGIAISAGDEGCLIFFERYVGGEGPIVMQDFQGRRTGAVTSVEEFNVSVERRRMVRLDEEEEMKMDTSKKAVEEPIEEVVEAQVDTEEEEVIDCSQDHAEEPAPAKETTRGAKAKAFGGRVLRGAGVVVGLAATTGVACVGAVAGFAIAKKLGINYE